LIAEALQIEFDEFLSQFAELSWRRLRGFEWLVKVVEGVKFSDGIEVKMQTRVKPNQPIRIAA